MIQLTTAVTVLVAYRFARRRTVAAAAGLGVAVGLAALSRAEAVLLPVLLVLPLCLFARPLGWRRRIGLLVVSGAAPLVVIGPWVGYNAVRYTHPVYLSSGFDPTLAVSNCDDTYFGQARGYWSYRCITAIPRPLGDESQQVPIYRKTALDYMKAH